MYVGDRTTIVAARPASWQSVSTSNAVFAEPTITTDCTRLAHFLVIGRHADLDSSLLQRLRIFILRRVNAYPLVQTWIFDRRNIRLLRPNPCRHDKMLGDSPALTSWSLNRDTPFPTYSVILRPLDLS